MPLFAGPSLLLFPSPFPPTAARRPVLGARHKVGRVEQAHAVDGLDVAMIDELAFFQDLRPSCPPHTAPRAWWCRFARLCDVIHTFLNLHASSHPLVASRLALHGCFAPMRLPAAETFHVRKVLSPPTVTARVPVSASIA